MWSVIFHIKRNEKRMEKLNYLRNSGQGRKMREKARGYVVAACRELKVKLSDDEIVSAAVKICF